MKVRRRLAPLAGWARSDGPGRIADWQRRQRSIGLVERGLSAGLLILALLVRVVRLGEANVWWDEGLAVWAARKSFLAMTAWTASDVHPPLYFWALWPWLRLTGETEFAVRYLTVIWSLLATAVAYAIARRMAGPAAGLLTLSLVALSRFVIWWSMETRMYMLAALSLGLAIYGLCRWLVPVSFGLQNRPFRRKSLAGSPPAAVGGVWRSNRWLVLYVLASLAALHTVYLAVFAVAWLAAAVTFLLGRMPAARGRLPAWLAAQAAIALGFLPWLAFALPRMATWRAPGEPATIGFVTQLWLTLLAVGQSTHIDEHRRAVGLFWLAALAAMVGWLAVERRASRGRRQGHSLRRERLGGLVLLLAGFLVLPPLVVWSATRPRPLFYAPQVEARYFVPFVLPTYVLLGSALATAAQRSRKWGALMAACLFAPMLANLPGHYAERRLTGDMYALVLAIWSQAERGDAVLLVSGNRYPLFRYYYDRAWVRPWFRPAFEQPADRPARWSERPPVLEFPSRGSEVVDEASLRTLAELTRRYRRLWLVEYGRQLQDPDGRVEAWLTQHRPRVLSERYGADALHLYAADGRAPLVTAVSSRFPRVTVARSLLAPHAETGSVRHAPILPALGVPSRRVMAGDTVALTAFVRTTRTLVIWLELADREAAPSTVLARAEAEAHGWDPLSGRAGGGPEDGRWARVRLAIPIDDRLPAGRLTWQVRAAARDGPLVGSLPVQGHLEVVGPFRSSGEVCGLSSRAPVAQVGPVTLQAARLAIGRASAGPVVIADLCWKAPTHLDAAESPTAFAHLLGPPRDQATSTLWAVGDGAPSGAAWPWQWSWREMAEAFVFDRHLLWLPAHAPPGIYEVEVGLYDPVSGERWPTRGLSGDVVARRVVVGRVHVR